MFENLSERLSGVFDRFPKLRIAYAEGQVGWMPYVIERMDKLWEERDTNSDFGVQLANRPSSYIPGHIWGCIFDDEVGLKNRDLIGMDQICFEVDYPHADTTFPHTKEIATKIVTNAGLDDDEIYATTGHDAHPEVAYALHNLADAEAERGRHDEATARYAEAIARKLELFGPIHHEVAGSRNNLAVLFAARGELERARQGSSLRREVSSP